MIRDLAGITSTRVVDVAPSSYDAASHTVEAVISMGSPVKRFYGTEILRIHESAVDTNRVWSGSCPILDSHRQDSITHALGRVTATWFRGNAFMGRLTFNQTAEGRKAEGMVARGEIAGISAGYRVEAWEILDPDGRSVEPDSMRWDDDGFTFTATRWELLEISLVSVPADAGAAHIPAVLTGPSSLQIYPSACRSSCRSGCGWKQGSGCTTGKKRCSGEMITGMTGQTRPCSGSRKTQLRRLSEVKEAAN